MGVPYPYPPYTQQPAPRPAPAPVEKTREERYYEPILLLDGVAAGGYLYGVFARKWSPIVFSTTAYWFTGPIVHWTEGQVGIGFASMGTRMGVPFVGLVLTSVFCLGEIGESGGGDRCLNYLATGYFLGMVATTAIDAGLFAKKTVKVEDGALSVSPMLGTVRGGGTLGLTGRW